MKFFPAMALGTTLLMGQTDYARQDALIFKANYYQPLDTLTMARYWRATALRSESIYNGNGSWGLGYADWPSQPYDADHPLVRVVARHALGLVLLIEENLADSSAIRRARLALNWLLERQTPEGAWPLYTTNRGVVSVYSVYPTALAARALSRGYQVFDNPRYQLAATKAALWQAVRPATDSPFHHGLVLAQLLEHYRALGHQQHLDSAVDLAMTLLSSQLPNGSWNDPGPLHTDEHAIITEALLLLEQSLQADHPRQRRIAAGATGALNFLLESQLKNGNYITTADEALISKVPTFELSTLVQARRARGVADFDLAITGATRAMNEHQSLLGNQWRGSQDGRFLGMAHALVWFVTTQAGLPKPLLPEYLPAEKDTLGTGADSLAFETGVPDTTPAELIMPDSITIPDTLLPAVPADSADLQASPSDTLTAPDSMRVPPAGEFD